MLNRIYSTDSAKAIKAAGYGYLNAIQYLAPHNLSGVNLCPKASASCAALCLGWFSGQASMVTDLDRSINSVRQSRIDKARRFMSDRAGYVLDLVRATDIIIATAKRKRFRGRRLRVCIRLNGSSDIAWEGIRFEIERDARGRAIKITLTPFGRNMFEHYPDEEFVDYTKIVGRFARKLPDNYHLTLSRSEVNEGECLEALGRGINVAVVFAGNKPKRWNGFRVIDGDAHDLRQLDPRGKRGVVVALSPKGTRAKRDVSGFVVH